MAGGGDLSPPAGGLLLTLEMDGESFARLDALRRQHYPAERNRVPAHVTLFHHLPAERTRETKAYLQDVVAQQGPLHIVVEEARLLERGVAVFLRSPRLHALRDTLAREWWPWLGEPDRRPFRPHVTIQMGTGEAEARRTQRLVAAEWRPISMRGIGLHLWRVSEAGWTSVQLFRFRR